MWPNPSSYCMGPHTEHTSRLINIWSHHMQDTGLLLIRYTHHSRCGKFLDTVLLHYHMYLLSMTHSYLLLGMMLYTCK